MSDHDEQNDAGVVTSASLHDWPLPGPGGSKRSRGRVLVLGGSPSTPGAVMLAGLAALRVGAGVLSMGVAASVAPAVAAAVPEASVQGIPGLDTGSPTPDTVRDTVPGANTVVVGPGIDDPDSAEWLVRETLAALDKDATLVVDAFALGVLPGLASLDTIAGRSVLTPNTSEAARLLEVDDVSDRPEADVARAIAERFNAVVSFSSHVAEPGGRAWSVPSGHPGLGTSGSGDVLAGSVAGLLARGADCAQAACWGTYLHATAGDRLAARVGRLGFLARELVDQLPLVIVETEA